MYYLLVAGVSNLVSLIISIISVIFFFFQFMKSNQESIHDDNLKSAFMRRSNRPLNNLCGMSKLYLILSYVGSISRQILSEMFPCVRNELQGKRHKVTENLNFLKIFYREHSKFRNRKQEQMTVWKSCCDQSGIELQHPNL